MAWGLAGLVLACLPAGGVWAEAEAPDRARVEAAAGRAPRLDRGRGLAGVRYVDESVCHGCHAEAAAAWRPSHHARAMQAATAETVLGDFDDRTHEQDGSKFRFFRREGGYFVEAEGADGVRRAHAILYTFGVEPLQQYLVAAPEGRLQALGVVWDVARRRWLDLYPDEQLRPGDAFHWTGRYQTWNAMCASCHSTDLRKAYDPETDSYETTWSVIDVGCQACHGPGARHVAWAKEDERAQDASYGLVVVQPAASARAEIEGCAPCHARRAEIAGDDPHRDRLLDDYLPATLDEGLYFADGQIRDEVYVYGSFLQSRMYAAGVRCTDCHEPHGLGLRRNGNALCTSCHAPEPERSLPGLSGALYDAPAHHHHPQDSAGARCVACHMPERTYMLIDPRRDHGFRVPRPDQTAKLGVPNACNACHTEQSAQWAAARVEEWYGPERRREPGFAPTIHDARLGDPAVTGALAALAAPGAAPDIVRATAVSLVPRVGGEAWRAVVDALADSDPLVRARAVSAVSSLPPAQRLPLLVPLLDDDVRAVRVETGRALAAVPSGILEPPEDARLRRAVAEYEAGQRAVADLPTGRMNLALLYTDQGRLDEAERQYRTAIAQAPLFLPPVANLAQLLAARGRRADAEAVLREGVSRMPREGELHYSLGLLLAENGELDQAAVALERAAALLPDRPRVHYNHGLVLQRLGSRAEAGAALERAARSAPDEPAFARALAIYYVQAGRWREARDEARRWMALAPGDPDARTVLSRAERALDRSSPGPR